MRISLFAPLFIFAGVIAFAQQPTAPGAASPPPATEQPATADLHSAQTDEGQMLTSSKIRRGSRIFISPMDGGFENFIAAGIQKKQVPLIVVIDRDKADYEMSGISDSEKAGWAKMLFLGSQQSNEEASVKVSDLKTGAVVFAYSVHKTNSYKGKQSAGEACAKHLKDAIE
jgi:hypothetical protein